MPDAVTIFRTWIDVADALPSDAMRGRLYHAICRYSLDGEEPQLDGILNTYFTLMRPSLDKSNRLRIAQEQSVKKRRSHNSQTDLQCNSQTDLQCNSQTDLHRARKTQNKTEKKSVSKETPKENAFSFATLLPPHLNREPFLSKWHEWEEYRRKKRKPISRLAMTQQIRLLSTLDMQLACAAIDNSIRNDYQGIFKPKAGEVPAAAVARDHTGI